MGRGAEEGDDDRRRAKNDELNDAAAIEQVKGKLQEDARGICRSRARGELGIVLECQRKGAMRSGAQHTESKEYHAPQNLECKRTRGDLNLGQANDSDGNGGVGGCLGLTFALGKSQ